MDAIKPHKDQGPKKLHPFKKANYLSKLFFCWLFPFLYHGYKKEITENNLEERLESHDSKHLGDKLQDAWIEDAKTHLKPSLTRILFKMHAFVLFKYGINAFIIEFIVKIFQAIAIGKLMAYYQPNQTEISRLEANLYGWLIILLSFIAVMLGHYFMLGMQHLGMKLRIGVCSLIYRKTLRLSKSALADATIGQMVNLLSNDVNRFDSVVNHFHDLWIAPFQATIIGILLYRSLGWTALSGMLLFILVVPLQLFMGKLVSVYRLKTAICTDQRVRLMNEIICGIQVIKMYTWEKSFAKLVEHSRKLEIQKIKLTGYIRAFFASLSIFLNTLAVFACLVAYMLTGNVVQSQYVYILVSYYTVVRKVLTLYFPQAFAIIAETNISVQRIEAFLMYEEINKTVTINNNNKLNETVEGIGACLEKASVKWNQCVLEPVLHSVDFSIKSGELVAIVGPVGSGKTTLLHVLLKELPLADGSLQVNGSISYASQESWLFGGTIQENILFGQQLDQARYKEVIRVCALERDLRLLQYGDNTIVGERGTMLSGGQKARINLARAVYKKADIYLLDDPLSAVDTHVGKQLFNECISQFLRTKCVVLVTHQLQYLQSVDNIYLLENGSVAKHGSFDELKQIDNEYLKLLEVQPKEETEKDVEKRLSIKTINASSGISLDKLDHPVEIKEEQGSGTISRLVYFDYYKAGGHVSIAFILAVLFLSTQLLQSGCDYFLNYWVNLEQKRVENNVYNITKNDDLLSSNTCATIYSGLVISLIIICFTRSMSFFRFCAEASKKLHNNMFAKIVYNSMRFFTTNPSGRILNRFSKDMGAIDEILPIALLDTIQIGLVTGGICLVVITVNPWIVIPTLVIAGIFYKIRSMFLKTSRNLKRVEGITRSPVFTHLSASIQGLTTIRAFEAEKVLIVEFDNHQNLNSAAFYMFLAANRTLGFWLDLTCVIYIGIVTLSVLYLQNEKYAGNVGLSITQAISLTGMLQWGIRQWTELENQMTSVERVVEYTRLVTESRDEERKPAENWPQKGGIQFCNVSMQYDALEPFVLKNLHFRIEPCEKIGIVGRTGAGKSSLISALFRLARLEGTILIDDVDTGKISLHSLRSKMSIIPQEPVLFSGTLRKNLDPFDEYPDGVLWQALEEVELKQAVSDLALGLHSAVSEGGLNFSVGQRQLLCLARAVLRQNRVLVMDEATANVDPQTDEFIQRTIRTKFKDCTVLTIAHRLNTVTDCDKILVMDGGRAVEFDHPYLLLQNESGIFASLVKETGRSMAASLTRIAKQNYDLNVNRS